MIANSGLCFRVVTFFFPVLLCAALHSQGTQSPAGAGQSGQNGAANGATTSPAANTAVAAQSSESVFKVTTRMVVIDIVAHDKKDRVVSDLEAADFIIREDGKEQKISTFNFQNPGSGVAAPADREVVPANVFR